MCVGHCGRHGVYGIKKDTLVSELMDGSVGIYGFFIRQIDALCGKTNDTFLNSSPDC